MKNFDDLLKSYISMTERYLKDVYSNKTMRVCHLVQHILTSTAENDVLILLMDLNVDINLVLNAAESCVNENERLDFSGSSVQYSNTYKQVIEWASKNAMKKETSILDFFLASIKIENELTAHYKRLGIDYKSALSFAKEILEDEKYMTDSDGTPKQTKKYTIQSVDFINAPNDDLYKYCDDMLKMAKENKYSPCIGRDREKSLVYRVLSRDKKGNVILIGREGVGKTQIIEGIAKEIVDGTAPADILDYKIISLNVNSLVAGTKYRGDFEDRLKTVFDTILEMKNVIIFIDEIHTVMGAGASDAGMDMSNILKPYLTKNEFKIIGATTDDEYRRFIEKNKAFKRRFQEILVEAPNDENCYTILMNIKSSIEEKHRVKFPSDVIKHCIANSNKYLPYRTQPDKSIDILQDTAIMVRMQDSVSPFLGELLSLKNDIHLDKTEMVESKNYDWAYEVLQRESDIDLKISKEKSRMEDVSSNEITISKGDIDKLIEEMVKIPVSSKLDVKSLNTALKNNIVGQDNAIKTIVQKLMLNSISLSNNNKPTATFLFVGGTGIGKTETAKVISNTLYGGKMVRIDCSEFAHSHDISKLIGTSAGYVGYEDGGLLARHLKYNPFSLVLFDEIEKAGDKLFDLLLQILDEGRVTDNMGETLDLKNCIVIMTSNVGSKEMFESKNSLGYVKNSSEYDHSIVETSIKKRFRPEFVNRIDKIVHFESLSKENIEILLNKIIVNIRKGVNQYGLTFNVTRSTMDQIIDKCFDSGYGYRELERLSEEMITIPLLEKISNEEKIHLEV